MSCELLETSVLLWVTRLVMQASRKLSQPKLFRKVFQGKVSDKFPDILKQLSDAASAICD